MGVVLKPVAGIALALLLSLTGMSMAFARGATAATGQMVICTGTGPVTVFVDAEGNPTAAPHLCPDCVLTFSEEPVPVGAAVPQTISLFQKNFVRPVPRRKVPGNIGFLSRAPPAAV